jgi:VanZ family protein
MALIFYMSSRPRVPLPSVFSGEDKLMHLLAYGILALFLARGLGPWRGGLSWLQVTLVTIIVSVYGMTDEYHQTFVPGRDASLADWGADTLGGLFGALLSKGRVRQ